MDCPGAITSGLREPLPPGPLLEKAGTTSSSTVAVPLVSTAPTASRSGS